MITLTDRATPCLDVLVCLIKYSAFHRNRCDLKLFSHFPHHSKLERDHCLNIGQSQSIYKIDKFDLWTDEDDFYSTIAWKCNFRKKEFLEDLAFLFKKSKNLITEK